MFFVKSELSPENQHIIHMTDAKNHSLGLLKTEILRERADFHNPFASHRQSNVYFAGINVIEVKRVFGELQSGDW
ncbi:unnamed protein product [Peronospora belbahrii]|uniref:Uncharacterized protein n=1 Tax=Peronospora belbahrii TaxID=622444 RepID=A0ABN8CNE4_9STRA|nr:unnamed protein product [Peronospora belbahrii]